MKKGLALLLAFAMVLTMAGCSMGFINRSDGEESAKDPEDPPAAAEPQEPAVPAGPDESVQGVEPAVPDPAEEDGPADSADEETGSSEVTVTASHKDVTLFHAGETFTMSAQGVSGFYACSFTSADPAVAAVDEATGKITAVAPGTVTVTMHVECEAGQFDFDCIVRCRWTGEEEAALPASGTAAPLPSLRDFFAALQGKYDGLGAMMVMEGELLANYYPGLDAIASVEEVYIQETMISVANVAVGLVKLSAGASPDDVIAVQNILQARINTQADGGAWYPESCETWEQGVITSTSNVVGMFVYPGEAQAMADLFTESFSN